MLALLWSESLSKYFCEALLEKQSVYLYTSQSREWQDFIGISLIVRCCKEKEKFRWESLLEYNVVQKTEKASVPE